MAININNYNDVFGKLTKAVDIASASDNEEIKKIFSKIKNELLIVKISFHFKILIINCLDKTTRWVVIKTTR